MPKINATMINELHVDESILLRGLDAAKESLNCIDSDQQLINVLSSVPLKFWTCPTCVRPRVQWKAAVATCLECGRSNVGNG
jgi:hypothetical protein